MADVPEQFQTELEERSIQLLDSVTRQKTIVEAYYSKLLDQKLRDELTTEVEEMVGSLRRARSNLSIAALRSFELADELEARYEDLERTEKTQYLFQSPPANSMIDYREQESDHFARGLNGYKVLWICFIGSFAGVVVELLWCLARHGYLESRSGLVYGPFNLLYGVGAVALTLALYRFRNRGGELSFAGGFLVGSVLEYLCSWGQEMLFGSRSWDYSVMPLNLNGRICLLYSIFWGVLGVLWIKNLYPRMAEWILKLPEKGGKLLTVLLALFFAVNITVSGVTVYRWSQRMEGTTNDTAFWQFIDERFPDERMEKIFANMEFVKVGE